MPDLIFNVVGEDILQVALTLQWYLKNFWILDNFQSLSYQVQSVAICRHL